MARGKRVQNKKLSPKPKKGIKKRARKSCETDFSKLCAAKKNFESKQKNISSKRVTVPLGFFAQGIKSRTVQKDSKAYALNQESCNLLNEDLHALLQNVTNNEFGEKPQCQINISNNSAEMQNKSAEEHYTTISDYYMKLDSEQELQKSSQEQTTEKNKSMFRKIDQCYMRIIEKQHLQKENIENHNHEYTTVTCPRSHKSENTFCKDLKEQLTSTISHSRIALCLNKIKVEIANINDELEGKTAPIPHSPKIYKPQKVPEPASNLANCIFPKSKWLYQTPFKKSLQSRQSLFFRSSNVLKPTVFYSNANGCKPLFTLSSDVTSIKFLQTNDPFIENKEWSVANNNYETNTDNFLYTNKNDFLLSETNEQIFQYAPTPISVLFNGEGLEQFYKDSPEHYRMTSIKRQKMCTEYQSINFVEDFNSAMAAVPDVLSEDILYNSQSQLSRYVTKNSALEYLSNHPRCSNDNDDGFVNKDSCSYNKLLW